MPRSFLLTPLLPRRDITQASAATRLRRSASAALVILGAFVMSGCLTPDFKFSEEGASTGGGTNSGPPGPDTATHCTNRSQDADETDIDCGGIDCDPCEVGRACKADGDCAGVPCTQLICRAASCTDDIKTGDETDVDCGGSCPGCGTGKRCETASDCESDVCASGKCAAPSCSDRVKNGDESDIDCGGSCDPCDVGGSCVVAKDCQQPPLDVGGTADCNASGQCYLKCPDAFSADCNEQAADGCEIDLRSDVEHCGSCSLACDLANTETSKCSEGVCEIDFDSGGCRDGFDDCNGMHDDGCEVSIVADPDNCGACNNVCSSKNGTASCSGSICAIDCNAGFDDCDNDPASNGCEVNLNTSILHCGQCGNACSANLGESAACDPSKVPACQSIACDQPADCGNVQPCGACDSDQLCNDKLNTTSNCGGCGISCAATNAAVACLDSGGLNYGCAIASCVDSGGADYENCDGLYGNGCESNVKVDVNNCGGCASGSGQSCTALKNNASLNIASITCSDGGCVITGCKGSFADCDGDPNNGCEIDKNSNDAHCGGCLPSDPKPGTGQDCDATWNHATGTCTNGSCSFTSCVDSNWGNCNGSLSDGCETDLRISASHCGACNDPCVDNAATASNTCENKQCVAVCESTGDDCDGNDRNGCENLSTDADNCGGCGNVCGGDGTSVSSASCGGSVCSVTCGNGLCPDNTVEMACTAPLGTTDNCASCGEVCGVSAPYCTPGGCLDHLQIQAVNETTTATGHISGVLTVSHSLATARANDDTRAVVVIAGFNGNNVGLPLALAYDGAPMTAAITRYNENGSWVGIYYILDADLPAAAGDYSVTLTGDSNNTFSLSARVIELIGMDQSSPLGTVKNARGNQGCATSTLGLSALATDSWVFSGFTITADQSLTVTGATAYGGLLSAGSTTNSAKKSNVTSANVTWACGTKIEAWAHVVAAFQPEGTD